MVRHRSALIPTLAACVAVGFCLVPWLAGEERLAAEGAGSFRLPPKAPPVAFEAPPPLQLTASDGTGLELVALEARGVLVPPLAFTEFHLAFENPRDREIEGRFQILLPPGAAISRFAMEIDGHWQEGEVVERQRARQVYEDFLYRKQDPALLEQQAGNEFSARVFPIPAGATKRLIVSWSHELPGPEEPYRIPLAGLPKIDHLDVRVLVGRTDTSVASASDLAARGIDYRMVELTKERWQPDRDFEVAQPTGGSGGLRHGELLLLRLRPPVGKEIQKVRSLAVLVDSSASRALGFNRQLTVLGELIAGLARGTGPDTPVLVVAFDQDTELVFEGRAGDFGRRHLETLERRGALGASDLEGALAWLDGHLRRTGSRRGPYHRLLLLTDGVATAGDTSSAALHGAVEKLGMRGVDRLDALAFGGLRDVATLNSLVGGGVGGTSLRHAGVVLDAAAPRAEVARRLTRAAASGLEVKVEGAGWQWPERLDGVQRGDSVLVYAQLPTHRAVQVLVGGRPVPAGEIHTVERPMLERAWMKARIDRLLALRDRDFAEDLDMHRAMSREVVELSVKHRVLSPLTALLVLETEEDYRRYDIDRTALADILTVGLGGLEWVQRAVGPAGDIPAGNSSVIEGRVVAEDHSLPGVELRLVGQGVERVTVTNGEGAFRFVQVPAGTYELTAALEGFNGLVQRVRSGAGPLLLRLHLAAITEEFVVVSTGSEFEDEAAPAMLPADAARYLDRQETTAAEPPLPFAAAAPATPEIPQPRRTPVPDPAPEEVLEPDGETRVSEETIVVTAEMPVVETSSSSVGSTGESPAAAEPKVAPWSGPFSEVMAQLANGRVEEARRQAEAWRLKAPGDVLALVALGETCEAAGLVQRAARVYGSLIDLFPVRADLRRYAGERLERLAAERALELAIDTFRRALEQRPDHPSGHRLLAYALLKDGRFAEAFAVLTAVLRASDENPALDWDLYPGVERLLREDLGLVAAAWRAAEPHLARQIDERLTAAGVQPATQPSLRFVLTWETAANDVDLHVHDALGGHAYYGQVALDSGGELFEDVTQGFGPEGFVIPLDEKVGTKSGARPYRLRAHYYDRGPMGYGLGKLQVIEHDGRGRLRFDERPFVVMHDNAFVELGEVE